MSQDKPRLPKEVAEELQNLRNEGWSDYRIIARIHDRWTVTSTTPLVEFAKQHPSPLLRALADGYEIEMTPEDKVREYFLEAKSDAESKDHDLRFPGQERVVAIQFILDTLGIKIDGVNT